MFFLGYTHVAKLYLDDRFTVHDPILTPWLSKKHSFNTEYFIKLISIKGNTLFLLFSFFKTLFVVIFNKNDSIVLYFWCHCMPK